MESNSRRGYREVEVYRDEVVTPLTEKDAKYLYEQFLLEEEECRDTGWYACIVRSSLFNGEVVVYAVCPRSKGTDYVYPGRCPAGWEELVGLD